MRWMVFVLVVILIASFSSATVAEIVLIDEIGSFSGAVLRIKSSVTGEIGDKIYASEYLTDVGIVKFEIETSLSEVLLGFVTSKDGMVVEEFSEGPFVVDGSEILVDRREKVEREVIKIKEETVEEEVEVVEVAVVEEIVDPIIVEDVVDDSFGNKVSGLFLTGKAVFVEDDGSVDLGHSIGGSVLILMFLIFIFMVGRRGKNKVDILNEDDKELDYMEKRVRLTEARISKVKSERNKRKRIAEAKIKLNREKKELEGLEKRERNEAEIIEDI